MLANKHALSCCRAQKSWPEMFIMCVFFFCFFFLKSICSHLSQTKNRLLTCAHITGAEFVPIKHLYHFDINVFGLYKNVTTCQTASEVPDRPQIPEG